MKNLACLLLLCLAGCSSSRIVSSWTAPEAGKAAFKKILVISHLPGADSNTRQQMEENLVNGFKTIGYNAVSFLKTFREKNFGLQRYDSMRARFQQQGIDGMITITLLSKEREAIFVPAKPLLTAESLRPSNFRVEAGAGNAADRAGYFVSSTQLFWESDFFDVKTQALLYKVQSTSFDPVSFQRLAQDFGRQIVGDLQKNEMLAKESTSHRLATGCALQ